MVAQAHDARVKRRDHQHVIDLQRRWGGAMLGRRVVIAFTKDDSRERCRVGGGEPDFDGRAGPHVYAGETGRYRRRWRALP